MLVRCASRITPTRPCLYIWYARGRGCCSGPWYRIWSRPARGISPRSFAAESCAGQALLALWGHRRTIFRIKKWPGVLPGPSKRCPACLMACLQMLNQPTATPNTKAAVVQITKRGFISQCTSFGAYWGTLCSRQAETTVLHVTVELAPQRTHDVSVLTPPQRYSV